MTTLSPEAIISTRTLIECDGMVLLMQRSGNQELDGFWELPGGKIDPRDTSFHHAAFREIGEETGMTDVTFLVPETYLVDAYTIPDGKHIGKPYSAHGLLARAPAGAEVQALSEHRRFKWLAPDAATISQTLPVTRATHNALRTLAPLLTTLLRK